MIGFFSGRHIKSLVLAVSFMIVAVIIGVFAGILNSFTLWFGITLVMITAIIQFAPFSLPKFANSPATLFALIAQLSKLFYIEFGLYTVCIIINAAVGDKFPHLINLVQIPLLLFYGLYFLYWLKTLNYSSAKVAEEKETVYAQDVMIASIDRTAASSYTYEVTDKIESLADSINTLGLGRSPEVSGIDAQIFSKIEELNEMMRTNAEQNNVKNKVTEIKNLIDFRKTKNRRY